MNKHLTVLFFLLFTLGSLLPKAVANEQDESEQVTQANEYDLNTEIVALVELASKAPNKTQYLLQRLISNRPTANYAEQYLILLIKAKLKQHQQQHEDVIALIEQAKILREHIVEKQLNQPVFSSAYLVLANSYAAVNDYEKAYQAKKAFVDEYNDYRDAKRESTVKVLTKKYEIAHKIEANKLLDNQNKLKELHIQEVHRKQQDQQRQFILITCTIIVFILLFLRQLKIRKKLLVFAQTDSLTGLLNRTSLFQEGKKLVETNKKHQLELSVLLFDVDRFKLINDEFGHDVGDLVLEKIAQLVLETMRSRDILARLGGEEFVALLPDTTIDKTKAIAMRVMEKINQFNFAELGVNHNITLSIGVASSKDTQMNFDSLLHAADLAMLQAKAKGRNQMVRYTPMPLQPVQDQ